jgi:hypothetical protein
MIDSGASEKKGRFQARNSAGILQAEPCELAKI